LSASRGRMHSLSFCYSGLKTCKILFSAALLLALTSTSEGDSGGGLWERLLRQIAPRDFQVAGTSESSWDVHLGKGLEEKTAGTQSERQLGNKNGRSYGQNKCGEEVVCGQQPSCSCAADCAGPSSPPLGCCPPGACCANCTAGGGAAPAACCVRAAVPLMSAATGTPAQSASPGLGVATLLGAAARELGNEQQDGSDEQETGGEQGSSLDDMEEASSDKEERNGNSASEESSFSESDSTSDEGISSEEQYVQNSGVAGGEAAPTLGPTTAAPSQLHTTAQPSVRLPSTTLPPAAASADAYLASKTEDISEADEDNTTTATPNVTSRQSTASSTYEHTYAETLDPPTTVPTAGHTLMGPLTAEPSEEPTVEPTNLFGAELPSGIFCKNKCGKEVGLICSSYQ